MTYDYYQGVSNRGVNKLHIMVASISAAILISVAAFTAAFALPAGTSTFGATSEQNDGLHLVSEMTNITSPYGGVSFSLPSGTTAASLTNLDATFTKLAGDCGGGSARFEIDTSEGNVFVYVGAAPNFTACANGSTGNLLATPDLRVDTSQLAGGAQYDNWANAQTLLDSTPISSLSFLVDSGWTSTGRQEFVLSSASVNSTNYNFVAAPAPTNKDQCKNGSWQTLGFKNQGQCVASVQSNENSKFNR